VQKNDRFFMEMALEEAKKGLGRTSPNPCVGAVVVRNGEVVGRGYHKKAGTPHAEVHALADAGDQAQGATIYVTLEPCNHTGRTPPCSHAVVKAGIARVVIGLSDPNPLACGGCRYLQDHGVEVIVGVCEKQCRSLNEPFLKWTTTGLPWVVMKAGMSLDGKITYQHGQGGAITGPESRQFVHGLRNRFDAILIGVETARIDDPSLTTRLTGQQGRDPLRVILDSHLRLAPEAKLLTQQSSAETWVFCTPSASEENEAALQRAGALVFRVGETGTHQLDLVEVLQILAQRNVLSLLVEGGAAIHGSFLRHDLYDEGYLFLAPFFIGEAGTALLSGYTTPDAVSASTMQDIEVGRLGDDLYVHGLFTQL